MFGEFWGVILAIFINNSLDIKVSLARPGEEILLGTRALYQNVLRFWLKNKYFTFRYIALILRSLQCQESEMKDFSNNIMFHLSGFPPLFLFLIVKFNIKYRIESPDSSHESKIWAEILIEDKQNSDLLLLLVW